MENKYLLTSVTFFIAFIISFFSFFLTRKFIKDEEKRNLTTYAIINSVLLFSILGIAFYVSNSTSIYDFNILEMIFVFAISVFIFITYKLNKTKKFGIIALAIGAPILYFFIPSDFDGTYNLFTDPNLLWLSNIILVLSFFIFSFMYKYTNSIEGNFSIQSSFIGLAISLIFFLGGTSNIIGLTGIALFAVYLAFFVFNSYPARLKLDTAGAAASGFIIVWILIKNGQETSISCSILMSSYFIIEGFIVILRKMTMLEKYKDMNKNTFAYQAYERELPVKNINSSVIKVMILMTIISCLQIYTPNVFSLPMFAGLIMLWFANKLVYWDTPKQSIKQINKEFINDFKDNISNMKNFMNRD